MLTQGQKTDPPLDRSSGDPLPINLGAIITVSGATLDGEKVQDSTQIGVIVDAFAPRPPDKQCAQE